MPGFRYAHTVQHNSRWGSLPAEPILKKLGFDLCDGRVCVDTQTRKLTKGRREVDEKSGPS